MSRSAFRCCLRAITRQPDASAVNKFECSQTSQVLVSSNLAAACHNLQHPFCTAERDDGSVMFCFGDEAEVKSAAVSRTPPKVQDQGTSSVDPQAVQGASQASQEQVQTRAKAHRKAGRSTTKQALANSSTDTLLQPAPASAASQQVTSSEAEKAATSEPVGAAGNSSSSADTSGSDEEASGSERLSDMTPQQLEGLKVKFPLHSQICGPMSMEAVAVECGLPT